MCTQELRGAEPVKAGVKKEGFPGTLKAGQHLEGLRSGQCWGEGKI